jgi:hypothetical protein
VYPIRHYLVKPKQKRIVTSLGYFPCVAWVSVDDTSMNPQLFSPGQVVALCHDMSFVGRKPSFVSMQIVTRVTAKRVFVKAGMGLNQHEFPYKLDGSPTYRHSSYMVKPLTLV